jgi:putative ABC transport system permease protein
LAIGDPSFSPLITAVAPELGSFGQVLVGGTNVNTRVVGVTSEYEGVRNAHVADGQFFSEQQVDGRSNVAILGATVAKTLFGDGSPVDQTVKINMARGSQNFRVIGVLEAKGSQATGSQDDLVLVPLTTLQQRLFAQRTATGGRSVTSINIQLVSEERATIDAAVQQIAELLRERHRVAEDDFTIQSQADLLNVVGQITGIMTLLLASIAGISLVVGGIGIMNIMLVSVTERTREIGIRKAVGAKRRDILTQFLIESLVVSIAGGALGMLLGIGLSALVGSFQMQGQGIPTHVTPQAILLATGVSAAIGIFFGIYPASRASRLSPIEALRYE